MKCGSTLKMNDKSQTRRTDWIMCKDAPWYPELSGGGIVAYRIWTICDDYGRWYQRHEWKNLDGSIDIERWIPGAKYFSANQKPVDNPRWIDPNNS